MHRIRTSPAQPRRAPPFGATLCGARRTNAPHRAAIVNLASTGDTLLVVETDTQEWAGRRLRRSNAGGAAAGRRSVTKPLERLNARVCRAGGRWHIVPCNPRSVADTGSP